MNLTGFLHEFSLWRIDQSGQNKIYFLAQLQV